MRRISKNRILLYAASGLIAAGFAAGGAVALALPDSAPPTAVSWYASAERLDPIFAIEGTDPAALRKAVASFLTQRDRILASLRGNAKAVGSAVYPEDFLNLLPDLESARQALLADPTIPHAQAYHALLARTIDVYRADARRLAQAIRAQPNTGAFTFQGGVATRDSEARALDYVVLAANEQERKENTRYACAQHFNASTCPSLDTLAGKRAAALIATSSLPAPDATVLRADVVEQALVRYTEPGLTDLSPFIGLVTTCTTYPVTYIRTWRAPLPNGSVAYKPYFANDVYFYDLSTLNAPNTLPLYAEARKEQVRYEYQNMANSYMCPDYGLLAADLMRVESMRELAMASSSPLARRLASAPYIQLKDAAAFARADGSDRAAERYLEGSADFDQIIGGLMSDNYFAVTLGASGGWMDASFFLIARNYASTLYLLGNPTFVPERITAFEDLGAYHEDPSLISWVHHLSRTIGTSDLLAEAKRAADLIRFKKDAQ